ncbi:UbiH/UbiF family hydroxylase [Microvirga massiliensis]|uniref:UbiH/UbiF family hydroxylase n=1 Tax=Microvirga massiliensis TaxID=1033741 RepID=UPI00062B8706|nr:UbiH/UbiF family hydroxylase [Microvirga massiliensis]
MQHSSEIVVVGAGAAGLAAALAFARDGFETILVGEASMARDGRTVALLAGSVRFLEALGVWPEIEPDAAPLETMRLIDDTGSLFRPPPVAFRSTEIGLTAFGWNVENATLVGRLGSAAARAENLACLTSPAVSYEPTASGARVALADGTKIDAALVVAADGRRSKLREAAGIQARHWSYPQKALTTILAHDHSHRQASTEFHTRRGPFTLVPLPGRRSSLVWVTSPEEAGRLAELPDEKLALAVEKQAQSMLGKMQIDGPRGVVPMTGLSVDQFTAPALALVGEAAHVFPPIGAQGLNLGFRDVAALRDAVMDAGAAGHAPGSEPALSTYRRGRTVDVALRTNAVDSLNRTLLSGLLPLDLARGAGLLMLAGVGPLRRAAMREGIGPSRGLPRLMRPVGPA